MIRQSEVARGPPIATESTLRVHLRQLGALFKKYTGRSVERELRNHFLNFTTTYLSTRFAFRREPKPKPTIGPDFFVYKQHFLWARDTSQFHIGLDRIDDSTIRLINMWTGCRKHELVYNKPNDHSALVKEYHNESDAFTDEEGETDCLTNTGRIRRCFVCQEVDERERNPELQILCWEDISLWILKDPEGNGGRDRLGMQILLRWHKGQNRKVQPTWYPFIEEDSPTLCPISHILAKALAEGVIATEGYQESAAPFFSTKLAVKAVAIRWKKEWLHRPVFRRTLNSLGEKSTAPVTAKIFDNHSDRLGRGLGLEERLSNYAYRRGYAETIDSKLFCGYFALKPANPLEKLNTELLFEIKGCDTRRGAPFTRTAIITPG
jgi:hypothetical protein